MCQVGIVMKSERNWPMWKNKSYKNRESLWFKTRLWFIWMKLYMLKLFFTWGKKIIKMFLETVKCASFEFFKYHILYSFIHNYHNPLPSQCYQILNNKSKSYETRFFIINWIPLYRYYYPFKESCQDAYQELH